MINSARGLVSALTDGPVPLTAVPDDIWAQVSEANVRIDVADGHLHLDSLPEYGWAAIVAGLDVPITVEYHESLPSTNDRARTLAEAGRSDMAVIAGRQTGGRGRRGRRWQSPKGGVWCSVIFEETLPSDRRGLMTFAAAVAICRTATSFGVDCKIKWPNDVLVSGLDGEQKLAGILTEAGSSDNSTLWVVVGMGVNANIPPESLPSRATSLRSQTGGSVDRTTIVQGVLTELWQLRDAPDEILDGWRSLTGTLGRLVQVETENRTVTGTAVDVTDTGALILETETGREVLAAGDCEHLRPT